MSHGTIEDERGDAYFLKFDPPGNPEMATAAEVISTKFFYAMGYHVPENYIVHWNGDYVVDKEADVIRDSGQITKPSREFIEELLEECDALFPGLGALPVLDEALLAALGAVDQEMDQAPGVGVVERPELSLLHADQGRQGHVGAGADRPAR